MKKILIGILAFFGLLAVAGVGAWAMFLVPPDAKDVCDNVMRLTIAQEPNAPAAAQEQLRELCMTEARTQPQFGIAPWVKRLKCMRDAQSMEALDACGGGSTRRRSSSSRARPR